MNTFVLEIWNDECSLCTFYTVRNDDDEITVMETETDKFFEKYDAIPKFESATIELLNFVLKAIGEDHGAIDELFNRHENEVDGLPLKGFLILGNTKFNYPNFPLRLFALRITNSIVVLFNGGIKDSETNQTSSLRMQWKEACSYAKRITEALRNREIIIENNKLKCNTGSDTICL